MPFIYHYIHPGPNPHDKRQVFGSKSISAIILDDVARNGLIMAKSWDLSKVT